jgi:hypothetical protein
MTRFNKMVDGCLIASLIFCQILLILKIKFCCLHCFQTWTRRLSTWLNGSLNQFELKKKKQEEKNLLDLVKIKIDLVTLSTRSKPDYQLVDFFFEFFFKTMPFQLFRKKDSFIDSPDL